jgi:uncharacterized protein (TIGR02271 family)
VHAAKLVFPRVKNPCKPSRGDVEQAGVIRAAKEELIVGKRSVQRARVRVSKTVRKRDELIKQPLEYDKVEIDRVPVNRAIKRAVAPHYEGDVLVIPVVEEVVVVRKQLMLKEELRIRKRAMRTVHKERVALRAEEVNVERLETARRRRA